MPKVILICGKICSGKSTYADKLRVQNKAVLLSCDEITLALFDQNIGADHDTIVERTQKYLFDKSVEIIETGINVILDWGFWTKEERDFAKQYYRSRNIACKLHYIDISNKIWKVNLSKRNHAIRKENINAYYVDDKLAEKFNSIFELPDKSEIDVWYGNEWNATCYCGHDCSRCVTYLATIRNDFELCKQSQRFYRDEFGLEIPLSEIHCMGGWSDDIFYLCSGCPWMKCCKEKGLSVCSDCDEYPCKPLAEYQEKYVNKYNQLGNG